MSLHNIMQHKQVKMCPYCYGLIKDSKSDINKFKKDKDIKWCDCKRHKGGLLIDRNIFKAVQLFNLKGYKTRMSCEGYDNQDSMILSSYITFYGNVDNIIDLCYNTNIGIEKNELFTMFSVVTLDENKTDLKLNFINKITDIAKNITEKQE